MSLGNIVLTFSIFLISGSDFTKASNSSVGRDRIIFPRIANPFAAAAPGFFLTNSIIFFSTSENSSFNIWSLSESIPKVLVGSGGVIKTPFKNFVRGTPIASKAVYTKEAIPTILNSLKPKLNILAAPPLIVAAKAAQEALIAAVFF